MPYIAQIYLSLQYSIFRPQCHILLIYISLYSTASAGLNAIYCSYVSLFTVQHLQDSMPYIAHMYLSLQYSICRPQCHIYCSYVSLFTVQYLQASMSYIAPIYLSLQHSIFRPQCHILLIYISLLQYSNCRTQCHILLIYISLYSTVSSGLNAIYCSYVSLFTVQYLQASMPYIAHMYLSL